MFETINWIRKESLKYCNSKKSYEKIEQRIQTCNISKLKYIFVLIYEFQDINK